MPDTPPDPVDTVERCAELSALLDDPFADRAAVLRAAGLDEESWGAVQERWVARLAAPKGAALVARYGEVYEATLRRLSSGGAPGGAPPDTDPEGPAFLSPEPRPWREEAARVGLDATGDPPSLTTHASDAAPVACAAGADETLPVPFQPPTPALPFEPLRARFSITLLPPADEAERTLALSPDAASRRVTPWRDPPCR
jgi:hypothetical protein